MTLRRITISVPEAIARKAQRATEAGEVESVSAYFAELAAREPDWVEARAALDEMLSVAYRIGLLLASSRSADVVDGHVAILGRSLGAVVLTSDPEDLRRLDPKLDIVVV